MSHPAIRDTLSALAPSFGASLVQKGFEYFQERRYRITNCGSHEATMAKCKLLSITQRSIFIGCRGSSRFASTVTTRPLCFNSSLAKRLSGFVSFLFTSSFAFLHRREESSSPINLNAASFKWNYLKATKSPDIAPISNPSCASRKNAPFRQRFLFAMKAKKSAGLTRDMVFLLAVGDAFSTAMMKQKNAQSQRWLPRDFQEKGWLLEMRLKGEGA